ncbi:carboxymuconolactone decarboxylase family protein [Stieleria sp. TO1_6]|uniref:carboxymuconolactone decarboxylase family protein n=1 Tax=Stieleria tagensis TaxID=2956795 RepID=UPI00209B3248|nr:carboxymuconolactone decarboxylase family protein [Stieleria tagensis]MCO8121736.1 carboxymuconolactone decarboxylase family protein [Stieleria tagensis]
MIPKPYKQMHVDYPDLMQAYESFGLAAKQAGPLSEREVALVKLAISLGAGLEGAAHSHCRKALEAGCVKDDLRHVALLAAPTIGFPTMMRAKSWVEDVVEKKNPDR